MWQSLINSDLEGIKLSSEALGVKEMYGLLACILTARSWDVVTTGLDQGPITDDEVGLFHAQGHQSLIEKIALARYQETPEESIARQL